MIELPRGRTPSQIKLYAAIVEQLELDRLDVPALPHKDQFTRDIKAARSGSGFIGNNRNFYLQVIHLFVTQNEAALKHLSIRKRLNALYLFTFLAYDAYFSDSLLPGHFYRWGGDLFDIDEATSDNIRTDRAYGLDCSGYVSSAIDILARFELGDISAVPYLSDRKKILFDVPAGMSSSHRLNVSEFQHIGKEIFSHRQAYQEHWEEKIHEGDFIVIPGADKVFPHVVVIVRIGGQLYIAESANTGSLTLDHFEKTGRLLTLEEGVGILNRRDVDFSLRSYF